MTTFPFAATTIDLKTAKLYIIRKLSACTYHNLGWNVALLNFIQSLAKK